MVRGPQAFTAVRELLLTVLSWAGMREPGNGFLGPYAPQTGPTGIGLCEAFLLGVPCGSLARYPKPAIRGRMVCYFFVICYADPCSYTRVDGVPLGLWTRVTSHFLHPSQTLSTIPWVGSSIVGKCLTSILSIQSIVLSDQP